MKSVIFGCLTAMTIGIAGASAQSATDKSPTGAISPAPSAAAPATPAPKDATAMNAASAMPDQKGSFITRQAAGTVRAPKLVGVAVYDSSDKSVGKIADLLLDNDGSVKAVVIGVGGFLGIGAKDVALPYSDVHWKTEPRKVEVNQPGAGAANPAAPAAGTTAQPEVKTVPTAETEAYQGYPDKAVLDMSQAQLKSAPEFHYAENPSAKTSAQASSNAPPRKD